MPNRFMSFLRTARWTSVIVTLTYHVRFLPFVDYEDVHAKTVDVARPAPHAAADARTLGDFAVVAAACVGTTVLATRAADVALDALTGRRPGIAT
jgi:hypothetical protein